MFDFSIAARTLVRSFGDDAFYRQSGVKESLKVDIERDLEVLDPESGLSQIVTVATFVKADYPFARMKNGDELICGTEVWKVNRRLEDDGTYLTVELGR